MTNTQSIQTATTVLSYRDLIARNDSQLEDYYAKFVDGVDLEADAMRALAYSADR